MITAYYRPENEKEALTLLSRVDVNSIGICGSIHFGPESECVEVVDLQKIGLDSIHQEKDRVTIGGLTYLNTLFEDARIHPAIKNILMQDYTNNQRNLLTLGGALYISGKSSLLPGVLLALNAQLKPLMEKEKLSVDDWLVRRREKKMAIVAEVVFSSLSNIGFEAVRKTPVAPAMIAVIAAKFKDGRSRIVLSGEAFEKPLLAVDDVDEMEFEDAIKNACSQYNKQKESADYITETSLSLLSRLLSDNHSMSQG
jgi:CO/xanthine dehydrogenase FAD-binding subunit